MKLPALKMELQVQEFNLCRSISTCLFSVHKLLSSMTLDIDTESLSDRRLNS